MDPAPPAPPAPPETRRLLISNSASGSPVAATKPGGGDFFFPAATGTSPVYESTYVITFPTSTTKSGTFKLGIFGE
jgi:hypothetical protein